MTHRSRGSSGGLAAVGPLWAAAVVILGLIVHQAGRLGAGRQARADVAVGDGLTVLTVAAGPDEDVIAVIDVASEVLSVYGVEQGRTLERYQSVRLADLFIEARSATGVPAAR